MMAYHRTPIALARIPSPTAVRQQRAAVRASAQNASRALFQVDEEEKNDDIDDRDSVHYRCPSLEEFPRLAPINFE